MTDNNNGRRAAAIAVTSVLLGGTLVAGSLVGQSTNAKSLEPKAQAALQQAGLTGANVKFKGREAYISGDAAQAEQAKSVVQGIYGVRWARISGDLKPATPPTTDVTPSATPSTSTTSTSTTSTTSTSAPAPQVEPAINIANTGSGTTVTGTVATQAEADALVAQAAKVFGEPVVNKVTVDPNCKDEPWVGSVTTALGSLPAITGGTLQAGPNGVTVGGTVASDADLAAATAALGTQTLPVTSNITVAAPTLTADEIKQINSTVVNFADGVYTLDAAATQKLDAVIPLLAKTKDAVAIKGYLSTPHPAGTETADSTMRAQAVADYLTAHGIDAARLQVQGLGTADPVGDNNTAEGRYANQRATLTLVQS